MTFFLFMRCCNRWNMRCSLIRWMSHLSSQKQRENPGFKAGWFYTKASTHSTGSGHTRGLHFYVNHINGEGRLYLFLLFSSNSSFMWRFKYTPSSRSWRKKMTSVEGNKFIVNRSVFQVVPFGFIWPQGGRRRAPHTRALYDFPSKTELEVGGDQVIDRCAFSSSDKVIKVNGCNFALNYNPNDEKRWPKPHRWIYSEIKAHRFSLHLWNVQSKLAGVDQCAVIVTVSTRRNIRRSASVGCHDLKGISKPQPGTLKMGYGLGLQRMSISCTTWGVHSLATSSSFLRDVSRRGDSGGWFQQQRYISVVDMKGKSSMWQLASGSSLQVSIMSLSGTERTGTIFSGVSLLRSSLWFGEPDWSSAFWGLSLELLPRDFWTLESPKHDFLCV